MSKSIFINALTRKNANGPASGPGTSIVSMELMDHIGAAFPEAHLDSEKMTCLAEAGHTVYGFDVVMPLFSVWHESAALGCPVDWGKKHIMPDCRGAIWEEDGDITIPPGFLAHPGCKVPLTSITLLKERLGEDAAVCGKVFGPWTLGYHGFGVQEFLVNTLIEPDMIKRAMEKLKEVTIMFAQAQIDAGADCLLLADHATRDLCSPQAYDIFLKELHSELVETIPCPLILHICGDTSDRIGMISETGIPCFHWDTKLGPPEKARRLAGERMSLMGGISNIEVLRNGTGEQIERAAAESIEAGIDIIAPECAVPLDTPMNNLQILGRFLAKSRQG
ncbi:MAG: uroporphyrinogen decarboxylase family protein [Candidatus Latescibacterota bacterium]